MAKTPERWALGQGQPYFEQPSYIDGSPPLYGVDFFTVTDNVGVVLHRPTMVIYYFYSQYDVPTPWNEWKWLGRYFVLGEADPALMEPWIFEEVIRPVLDLPLTTGELATDWLPFELPDSVKAAIGFVAIALAGKIALASETLSGVVSVVSGIQKKLTALWAATAGIRKTIAEKIAAAKKLYTAFAEKVHFDELLIIERVLDLTSEQYAKKKTEFLERIGAISKELFGDVHVVNQWINLAGMAFKDLALLEGYTWVEQDMEWLVKSADFLVDVEDRLEAYARHPESLWLDIESELVKPIYEARAARMTASESARADLVSGAGMLQKGYQDIDRRLRQYQLALPDNVKKEFGPGLTKLRKDLREFYSDDLKGVIDGIKYAAGLSGERIRSMKTAQRKIAEAEYRNTRILTKPKELTEGEKTDQRAIFSSIQSDIANRFNAFSWKVLESENPKWGDAYRKIWEGK